MRVLVDTNVLISAFVFGGKPFELLDRLPKCGHKVLVSDYVDDEFARKTALKWPAKSGKVYELLHLLDAEFCRSAEHGYEGLHLRDKKDEMVLFDAIANGADVIVSGDRDLLDANVEYPVIMSPADAVERLLN